MANGTNGTPQQQNAAPRQGGAPARNGAYPSGNPPKKADVIIQITRDISKKQEDVRNQTQLINSRLESVADISNQSKENAQEAINKSDVVYNLLVDSISALKQEMTYLAAQSENIYLNLTQKLSELNQAVEDLKQGKEEAPQKYEAVEEVPQQQVVDYDAIADKLAERLPQPVHEVQETVIDYDLLSDKIAGKIPAPVQSYSAAAPVAAQPAAIDYDELSARVASRIPVQEAISPDYIASKVAEQIVIPASETEIDYDVLAKKVAQCVGAAPTAAPTPVVVTSGGDVTIDYEYLADKVANKILVAKPAENTPVEVDYDLLADKVAGRLHIEVPAQTAVVDVDYDLLADKVADRLHIEVPTQTAAVAIDYETLADKVADRVITGTPVQTAPAAIDLDALADKVAERIPEPAPVQSLAAALPSAPQINIDEDELADKIALKVGSMKSDDFDIIVDDAGCDSLSRAITRRLDYDTIAAAIADKISSALDLAENGIDYDEMAATIGDKIHVAGVNEDAIAEKAAAVLSNYLPDIDTDEIADKVVNQVLSALPVNDDTLADRVADKVVNSLPAQEELDTDALAEKVVTQVVDALPKNEGSSEEPEALQIELDYDELAERVATQVVNSLPESSAAKAQIGEGDLQKVTDQITVITGARFASIDKDLDKIKSLLEKGVKVAELAPASAEQTIAEDNDELVTVSDVVSQAEEPSEPTGGEGVPDPKTVPSGDEESLEIGDELSETSGGVDFINMMKYNRSFIARIIQGTDDQKEYYGKIKTALLSYKKVNSNIAWGAERFHKGRETIARLKIRGKTLVLYLALDPAEFPYSVYFHKDVSDNKSLHGTPLAVKVMSPLGVRKAIRLIDAMLEKREGIKRPIPERNYAEMYPYETIEELIADGLVQDVRKP